MASDFKVSKNVSIQDICEDIVLHSEGSSATNAYKNKVFNIIKKAVDHYGWCACDIYDELNDMNGITTKNMEEAFYCKSPVTNLLKGLKRTHRQTHIVSAAPVVDFDEDIILNIRSGDVKYQHYMEEMASFDINDLLDYFLRNSRVVKNPDTSRIKSILKLALERTGNVNIVLYMIDDCMRDYKSKGQQLYNYISLLNYSEYGYVKNKEMVDRIATGTFKFIPRIR